MRVKRLLVFVAMAASALAGSAHAATISGAGATFPQPIYAKWAELYKAQTGVSLDYQPVGSGAGIKQIKARAVDFGASDMPLSSKELNEAGLVQFPVVMGGVVPIVNLQGILPGQIRLSGPIIAEIFLGKILFWNAPQIAALNPALALPNSMINVVHRGDSSGTTFLWSDFLSKSSPEWHDAIGAGTSVKWATGVSGKGNEGVADLVRRTPGSIGYVEWGFAKKHRLSYIQLRNREGVFVHPGDAAFKAAAASANWSSANGFSVVLTDQPGKNSWPVTGASYILMQKRHADGARAREVLKFFSWALRNGDAAADELDYVPMPGGVSERVQESWGSNIRDASGNGLW